MKHIKYIFIFTLLWLNFACFGQNTQINFGKNRIQYKAFNWKFISTTNFDIYFSDGGYDNAVLAAKYAEIEYQRIIHLIDYSPFNKIKIIIYNSHNDLLQSNIQSPEENPALGGQINFIKSKIEVPFEGNQLEFKRKISEQITRFLITDMMYGGTIRNTYRNTLFLVLPEWYINGLAAYISSGWSAEMDDHLRDLFSHFKINNPNAKSNVNQTLIGQSVWHYIVESQGKSAIANVLTLTRISRSYESGISNNVGLRYSKFEKGWRDYYRNNADVIIDSYTLVDEKKSLKRNRNHLDYYQVKSSPDGKLIAYSESNKGRYKVYVKDVKSGKKYHFLTGGYKSIDQELNTKTPLISWKSDRVLSVIETKNNKIQMTTREISGGYTVKKIFGTFDQVIDFDYADDGNSIVFSAEKEGKSDIFVFGTKTNAIKQITNDLYDETNPVFLKGSNSFIFSSNRNVDTLNPGSIKLATLKDNTDIFIYDATISTTKVKRLTNTMFHEKNPVCISKDEIAFLQDETGIYNISVLDIKTGTTKQVTNFQQDIQYFDLSYNKNLSFIIQYKAKELLFANYEINFAQEISKPIKTPRREAANFIENIFNLGNNDSINQIKPIEIVDSVVTNTKDSTLIISKSHLNEDEITFDSKEQPTINKTTKATPKEEEEIDINNYTFESEGQIIFTKSDEDSDNLTINGISTKYRTEESIKISDFKPMRPLLNMTNTINSIIFDPLRGFGLVGEVAVCDMLENHKFKANVFGKLDFRTSSMYFEYEYLKKRVDYKIKYEKQRLYLTDTNNFTQKSGLDKLEFTVTYPFSPSTKISFAPSLMTNHFYNLNRRPKEDKRNYFFGEKIEFMVDNTIVTGMNMIEGTRLKITSDNYISAKEEKSSFSRIEIDLRNYKKIHKEIILATRVSAGTYLGVNSPTYILGGVDNWAFAPDPIISNTDTTLFFGPNTDSRRFLFNKYVTNVRGFDYGQLKGNTHLLFNAELRIPLVKYLYKGLMNSEFMRNLQIIGFYDIGSAWTGTNPFNSENSFNTTIIDQGTIKAKVINFKNPFLSSYGPGIHTHALGYYFKFDVAWPIQDYENKKPRFILSLGYDF